MVDYLVCFVARMPETMEPRFIEITSELALTINAAPLLAMDKDSFRINASRLDAAESRFFRETTFAETEE